MGVPAMCPWGPLTDGAMRVISFREGGDCRLLMPFLGGAGASSLSKEVAPAKRHMWGGGGYMCPPPVRGGGGGG